MKWLVKGNLCIKAPMACDYYEQLMVIMNVAEKIILHL